MSAIKWMVVIGSVGYTMVGCLREFRLYNGWMFKEVSAIQWLDIKGSVGYTMVGC